VVVLELGPVAETAVAAERELSRRAARDRNRCCGYFPALSGAPGIIGDLPACEAFATRLPQITYAGTAYRFNFMRLSLVQQSTDPAYHLDSDADAAITGDLTTLRQRRILRLLLNLSPRVERSLHYLDVDPWSVELAAEGSYLCAAQPAALHRHARVRTVPRRHGPRVHAVAFASNLVLHSGVDDARGHFVAAYGIEPAETDSRSTVCDPPNAASTRPRNSR